jgi:uncharacterized membrane protein YhaH (DUF805 family)
MPSISSLFRAFIVIAIALNILQYALELLGSGLGMLGSLVSALVSIAIAIVCLGMSVRRYHDFDWSGWFVLLNLIPFVNLVMLAILLFKQGSPAANRFGEPFPKEVPLKEAILNKAHAPAPAASVPAQPAPMQQASPDPVAAVQPETPAEEQPKTDLV